jgi:hypothetical protein
VGVIAAGGTVNAQSGPGGGGLRGGGGGGGGGGGFVPFGDVVGTWMVVGDLTFPTVVTFTGANGQFTNRTFTWKVANTLTGQVSVVQGIYTVGPVPEGGLIGMIIIVSQGVIVFRGLYAQPGPGEFIIETFPRGFSWVLPIASRSSGNSGRSPGNPVSRHHEAARSHGPAGGHSGPRAAGVESFLPGSAGGLSIPSPALAKTSVTTSASRSE